jgi:hypothetical protein
MHKYRHFGQGESGVFNCSNSIGNLVGTSNVGPCIVLFIHDAEAKQCYAVHLDDRIHFNAIKNQIAKYIGTKERTNNFRAFLVGGWNYFKRTDHAVPPLLEYLKKLNLSQLNIDHLYKKNGSTNDTSRMHYYESVVFDINKGTLCLLNAPNLILGPETDRFIDQKVDCFKYIRRNSIPVSDVISSVKDCDLDSKKFFSAIVSENNGTAIIPAQNFEYAISQELLNLAILAQNGDSLGIIKALLTSFANPVTAMVAPWRCTPLHYACLSLSKKPNAYEQEVIVMLLLLYGQRDLSDTQGRSALSFIPEGHFKTRCTELLRLIDKQQTPYGTNFEFVKCLREVSVCLANDVIMYRKYPSWRKDGIHDKLTEYFKKLFMVPLPQRPATNLNKIVLFLAMMLLLYRFYENIDGSNQATHGFFNRNSKRLIM